MIKYVFYYLNSNYIIFTEKEIFIYNFFQLHFIFDDLYFYLIKKIDKNITLSIINFKSPFKYKTLEDICVFQRNIKKYTFIRKIFFNSSYVTHEHICRKHVQLNTIF